MCIDVIEHVPDYEKLLREMIRSARKMVFISTPNRKPEFTRANGKPRNPWHIREWSFEQFNQILLRIHNVKIEWKFLDGTVNGPFQISKEPSDETYALVPIIWKI